MAVAHAVLVPENNIKDAGTTKNASMPLYLKKNLRHARLGIWEITEAPGELYQMASLSSREEAFYARLKTETRKKHWLSYRLLLPKLLPGHAASGISYDKFGKPFLDNGAGHISVAHSGKFAALIVSEHCQAGIDIEHIQNKILGLTHKFLTSQEQEYHFPTTVRESLYVIWCAKEALYKLHGQTGMQFSKHLEIEPFVYTGNGTVIGYIRKGQTQQVMKLFYETIEEYMLVYTLKQP